MRLIIVLSYWMIYLYFYRDKISHKQKILILNKQSITYKDYNI